MAKLTKKSIKYRIEAKVKDWLSSIKDETVRKAAAKDVIVTGGCIPSMLLDERVKDYDIYFRTMETAKIVAEYYVKEFIENPGHSKTAKSHVDRDLKPEVRTENERVRIRIQSAGVASESNEEEGYDFFESSPEEDMERFVNEVAAVVEEADQQVAIDPKADDVDLPRYRPIFLSDNAITLANGVQLIIRFYGDPAEIHANYDYVHCTCYWTPADDLVCPEAALMSILTKELRYQGSLYPICALIRTRKFIARGWRINAGQYVKMCDQVNDLDLTSIAVWEDQLTGVDTAYFRQLIDILRNYAGDDGKIEKSYVITLVDRMF